MENIISFEKIKNRDQAESIPVLTKTMDGKVFLCIDIDKLSASQRERYFTGELDKILAAGTSRIVLSA